jgi:hypothetical protein
MRTAASAPTRWRRCPDRRSLSNDEAAITEPRRTAWLMDLEIDAPRGEQRFEISIQVVTRRR